MTATLPVRGPSGEVGATSNIVTGLPGWNSFVDDAELNTQLQWPNSTIAFEKMRNDSQIAGLLTGTTLPLKRRRWMIDPNGASDRLVQEMQEDLGLPLLGDSTLSVPENAAVDWDETLHHILLALAFGFMPLEIVGEYRDDAVERWRLSKLAPRMPRSINEISVFPNGELQQIRQTVGWNTPPIPAHRLLWAVWQKEGGNWVGRSMLRPLYGNWLMKDRLIRIDVMAHERAGVPTPVAKPAAGSDPTNRQMADMYAAAAAVKAGEATGLALPPGWDMDFKGGTSRTGAIASVEYHDQVMARCVMMMVLSLGQGGSSGNRALGGTFADLMMLGQDAMADWVAKLVTRGLFRKWTTWTEGEDAPSPRLVSAVNDDVELPTQDLVSMVDKGLITVDPELERHLRRRGRLPEKPTETDDAPAGQSYAYDLEGGTITVNERRAQLGLAEHPSGLGDLTLPEMQRELGIGTDGVSQDEADMAAFARRKRRAATTPAARRSRKRTARAVAAVRRLLGASPTIDPDKLPERELRRKPYAHEVIAGTNFRALDDNHRDATDDLFDTWWNGPREDLVDDLVKQIADADGDLVQLAALTASDTFGQAQILDSMVDIAEAGASEAAKEAAEQGVSLPKPSRDELETALEARAEATAIMLNRQVTESAVRAALRDSDPQAVRAHITGAIPGGVTGAMEKQQLGGGLWQSQETGRREVMEQEAGTYYSSELLDSNTCSPCTSVDGTEYDTLEEAEQDYPTGGYHECEGRESCRGTLVKVYAREGTTEDDD